MEQESILPVLDLEATALCSLGHGTEKVHRCWVNGCWQLTNDSDPIGDNGSFKWREAHKVYGAEKLAGDLKLKQ